MEASRLSLRDTKQGLAGWLAGWLAGRVSRPIDIIITNSHRVVKCLSPSEARVRRTGGGLIKRGHRTARRVMRIS